MCLLMPADSKIFLGVWNDLKKNNLLVTDNYPKTLTAAYDVLCWYKKPAPPSQTNSPPGAATFVQHGNTGRKTVPGNYG